MQTFIVSFITTLLLLLKFCRCLTTTLTLDSFINSLLITMFFTPSTITSSSISDIKVSVANNQAIVTYKGNDKVYLYNNVSFDELLDFVTGEFESVGKFVNAYCKGNDFVVIA